MKQVDYFWNKKIEKILSIDHILFALWTIKTAFLRIKKVSNLLGISASDINSGVKEETFPSKNKLSAQRIGFRKNQIDLWIDGKKENWYDVS